MNRKNRVCSAALSAVLTLTLVTAPAQALDTAGAERTEGGYAVMQAVSGLSIGEIDSSGIIYNGKAQTPTPKITVGGTELVAGTDFRMEYSNNVHAGTGIAYILGMGKYAGYVGSCEFTIHPAQLVVKVDDVQDVKDPASYTYTILQGTLASGDSLGQPQYSVKDNGNSTKTVSATFQDNADYEITVLPGTLTIVQTLGTVVISGPSNVFYNGSAQTPKPTVQDASTGKTLTEGRDYNLVYRNNVNAGKASVTINGIGSYSKVSEMREFTIQAAPITVRIRDVLSLPVTGVAGWLMTYNISYHLSHLKGRIIQFLEYCGEHTLYIFIWHVSAYKVVSLLKIWWYGLDPRQIGCHMVIHDYAQTDCFWILYTIAGVGIPLSGYWLYSRIRQQRRFF